MRLFWKKQSTNAVAEEQSEEKRINVEFDSSILRKNGITRLSIDERWTKLFVAIKITPELEKAEQEMNELIKEEAMLKNEQDNLEPQKRKCMNEILNLTKEAFENDSDKAKGRLKQCKKEIERINSRIDEVMEDIEELNDKLKKANLDLLNSSINYIFSTLKNKNERALEIKKELKEIEQRQKDLKAELETIKVDWTQYAVDLTNLIGTDPVKEFEEAYKLEGLKDEAVDTSADESD
ncbi:MAG: coiled-coil domain-containing protein [Acetivibrionales bacterium]|jgi:chromosome segregation ATPase